MITEDYVSFETAKLLKEKEFDGKCYKVWETNSYGEPNLVAAPYFVEGETCVDMESVSSAEKYYNDMTENNHIEGFLAPTLQMAMKWLRTKHGFYVHAVPNGIGEDVFYMDIYYKNDGGWFSMCLPYGPKDEEFSTPEEACEAAIKYCLENLI